jgi:peptidoglycan/xylan/chitin deacetylase (PgdA/CDA1 family)
MKNQKAFDILRRIESRYQKERSHNFAKRTILWPRLQSFISFTFDDFPRSAYLIGAKILEERSLRGTFFASLGLMGRSSPSGEIFAAKDLEGVVHGGHEIGSHTYDHLDPWSSRPSLFEESLIRNQSALNSLIPGHVFRTLAYPLTEPHPRIKRVAQKHFDSCRGGGRKFNLGRVDLNLLKSYFIDKKNRENLSYFEDVIETNRNQRGWLIFSTHDVSDSPSDFGCHPHLFERLVNLAVESTATVLPISEVLHRVVWKAREERSEI